MEIYINSEFIKLDQLLKFAELVDSGGFAKLLIAEGLVMFNGKACLERGKKIRPGDEVTVNIPNDEGQIEETIILKVLKKV